MQLARPKIKWLTRLMLVLILFAQGIVAANACVSPTAGAVQAFAQVQPEAMPCHEHSRKTPNANACLEHCTQSDQVNVDQHSVPMAAPVSIIAWVSPPLQYILQSVSAVLPAPDTGPPIPIRFCSFLN
jgi:hypothetical protein